jgi:hypothetical protein
MLDKDRIKRFHAALAGAKLMDYKADMLAAYGVESSKELSPRQADELIRRLNAMQSSRTKTPDNIRRARSVVLTLLNRLGIYADNGDWSTVNRFLLNPRIAGKMLYELNEEELKALSRKLRAMIKKREDRIQEENYQAANN